MCNPDNFKVPTEHEMKLMKERYEINEDGICVAKIKYHKGPPVGEPVGCRDTRYMNITVCSSQYRLHRVVWFLHTGEWPNGITMDHINGNGFDNRPKNLRVLTVRDQTIAFRKKRKGCSSKYRGVNLHKANGKWRTQINLTDAYAEIGYFDCEIEAAHAYDCAASFLGYYTEALNCTHHSECKRSNLTDDQKDNVDLKVNAVLPRLSLTLTQQIRKEI